MVEAAAQRGPRKCINRNLFPPAFFLSFFSSLEELALENFVLSLTRSEKGHKSDRWSKGLVLAAFYMLTTFTWKGLEISG